MIDLTKFKVNVLRFVKNLLWYIPFLLILFLDDRESKKIKVKFCEDFKKEEYYGRVLKKYVNYKQHGYKMLVILINNKRDSLNLTLEESGFWDIVQKNDSIVKIKDTYRIYIANKDTTFSINCYLISK